MPRDPNDKLCSCGEHCTQAECDAAHAPLPIIPDTDEE